MARIQRPSIPTYIRAKPMNLGEALAGIVATLAEAHKRAEPEFVDIAAMRLDVITYCRRLDDATLEAEHAQRVSEQLMPSKPGPATRRVPLIPFCRSAAHTHLAHHSSIKRHFVNYKTHA